MGPEKIDPLDAVCCCIVKFSLPSPKGSPWFFVISMPLLREELVNWHVDG
jgi:hypothetical protein